MAYWTCLPYLCWKYSSSHCSNLEHQQVKVNTFPVTISHFHNRLWFIIEMPITSVNYIHVQYKVLYSHCRPVASPKFRGVLFGIRRTPRNRHNPQNRHDLFWAWSDPNLDHLFGSKSCEECYLHVNFKSHCRYCAKFKCRTNGLKPFFIDFHAKPFLKCSIHFK